MCIHTEYICAKTIAGQQSVLLFVVSICNLPYIDGYERNSNASSINGVFLFVWITRSTTATPFSTLCPHWNVWVRRSVTHRNSMYDIHLFFCLLLECHQKIGGQIKLRSTFWQPCFFVYIAAAYSLSLSSQTFRLLFIYLCCYFGQESIAFGDQTDYTDNKAEQFQRWTHIETSHFRLFRFTMHLVRHSMSSMWFSWWRIPKATFISRKKSELTL